jgi:hypothetical protein
MYILRRITPLTVAMLAVLLALAFGALALFGGNRAEAEAVTPVLKQGNFNCANLTDLPAGTKELRIEPVADGTYSDGTLMVTIDVRNTGLGPVFDFTANQTIVAVAVKGGPNTNLYDYRTLSAGGVTADTGLHAPAGSNGRWSGLSHISFCYVEKSNPTLVTQASAPASDPVTLGQPISDTATLSGGNSPTGTITFKLYSTEADCKAGTNAITTLGPVTVNGNGNYNSGNFTPSAPGTYFWTAEYSGDAKNNPAIEKSCAANEQSVVNKAPSAIATEQSFIPNDKATVTGHGTPGGTVKFELFEGLDCTGTLLYTETVNLDSNGTASTDNSGDPNTNGGYTITTPGGDFSWKATYSGDANNEGSTSCKEESRVTIDNDDTVAPNPLQAITT